MLSFSPKTRPQFGVKQPLIQLTRVVEVESYKLLPLHKRVRLNTIVVARTTRVLLLLFFMIATVAVNTPRASAFTVSSGTGPVTCADNSAMWDWPKAIKEANHWYAPGGTGGSPNPASAKPDFDPGSGSYMFYKLSGTHDAWSFGVAWAGVGNTLIFNKSGDQYVITSTGGHVYWGTMSDRPEVLKDTTMNPVWHIGGALGQDQTTPLFLNTSAPTCISAKNVTYSAAWDIAQYQDEFNWTEGAETSCSVTDVGCWVTKAFKGVSDTLSSVFRAFSNFIASIFMPDSATVQADFNSFNTFMQNKLGFIAYPFTFMVDLFNSFGSGTAWCTDTSCTKSFGTIFGTPVSINLTQVKTTAPTLWTWFTGMMRGLLVLGLIFAVREKYKSIIHK